jgi:hypothetical protein
MSQKDKGPKKKKLPVDPKKKLKVAEAGNPRPNKPKKREKINEDNKLNDK